MKKRNAFLFFSLIFVSLSSAPPREQTAWSKLYVKHKEKGGVGFHEGYSTLQLFSAVKHHSSVLYSDLRAHQFDNGKAAGNFGLGYRYGFYDKELTFGVNGYYDVRQGRDKVFHQLGTGFECLNSYVDFRVNGYFPLGTREENLHCNFSMVSPNYFLGVRNFHKALTGVDGELGRNLFCHKKITFYGAAGCYYFGEGKCSTSLGVKGRFKAFFGDFFSLEATLSHDEVFKTKFQGQAALSIPLYPSEKKRKKYCCDDYRWNLPSIAQLPERNDMIVMAKGRQNTIIKAWVSENKVFCSTFVTSEPVFENEAVLKNNIPVEVVEEIEKMIAKESEEIAQKEIQEILPTEVETVIAKEITEIAEEDIHEISVTEKEEVVEVATQEILPPEVEPIIVKEITEVAEEVFHEITITEKEEVVEVPTQEISVIVAEEVSEKHIEAIPPKEPQKEAFVIIEDLNDPWKIEDIEKLENVENSEKVNIPLPETPEETFFLNRFLQYIKTTLRGK